MSKVRIAINGMGRIGRNMVRALYEGGYSDQIEVVAINDLGDVNINAHLLKYDTAHGRFGADVSVEDDCLVINGDRIRDFTERDPSKLPWGELGIDVVCECTGQFNSRDKAAVHLNAGADKVLLSAPGKDVDATIVFGINSEVLKPEHRIVSNASCTTNCLAPVAKPLNDSIGISHGLMTTIHAYTNDQRLSDVYHSDLYRARSATHSMIPTKTGAAAAVGLVLPELNGKLDGLAVRVPTINVSMVDLTFTAKRPTSIEEVNGIMSQAAAGPLSGILEVNELPLVSIDFNHNPASSIFDANHTRVNGDLVKVMAWYDNEWGFSNRMLDNVIALARCK
ncbi:MAG: type I glyceraldehyde-3-phosphate dehydrogenase [Oceanospirillaceae bacterium]|uniref:type I glyceraldehyde-3-phosphate dehydrogenase n=1 Tax=Marinobacterium litorale TaxID=404770 RepID=UPI00040D5D00|nr:type I glyceraldehyde-3-phosphate dehydrogenase [Marinobacterium litorale]MBS99543.1 type I glyceraldehyde-3-phosphate dehydrogenase [Oceanospirillaceae bacterium]